MKPAIYDIVPFDATKGTIIKLSWTGRQQKANKVWIQTNDTHVNVYQSSAFASYKGVHNIPADTTVTHLANGSVYRICAKIIDMDDVESEWSDWVTFRCFTTPVYAFNGITEGTVIQGSNVSLLLTYSQAQNEPMNKWIMYLYDQSKTEIARSKESYWDTSQAYYFSGLDDMATYYVRSVGETLNKMPVDTGYVKITVNYINPPTFVNFQAENNPNQGNVHVQSFVIAVDGVPKFEPVQYYPLGSSTPSAVYLLDGNEVYYTEGFELTKDFTAFFRFMNPVLYGTILIIKTVNQTWKYELKWWKTHVKEGSTFVDKYQVYMVGKNTYYESKECEYSGEYDFSMWSNSITAPAANDMICLAIQRIDGLFTLVLKKIEAN